MAARNGKCTVPGFVYNRRKVIAAIVSFFIFFETRPICLARAGIGLCRQRSPFCAGGEGGACGTNIVGKAALATFSASAGSIGRAHFALIASGGDARLRRGSKGSLSKRGVRLRIQRRPCQGTAQAARCSRKRPCFLVLIWTLQVVCEQPQQVLHSLTNWFMMPDHPTWAGHW